MKKRILRENNSEKNAGVWPMIFRDQGNEDEKVLKEKGDVVSRRE